MGCKPPNAAPINSRPGDDPWPPRSALPALWPRDHYEVVPIRQAVGNGPESIAEQPLYAITLDRAANLASDRHTEARRILVRLARKRIQDEVAIGMRTPLAIDAIELSAP